VPDVTVLDRDLPIEQVITHPPVAVVEILSPEDTVNRLLAKLADYDQMGIRTILVIDPKKGRHLRYNGGALEPLPPEPFDLPAVPAASTLRRLKSCWTSEGEGSSGLRAACRFVFS
jgi:putative restriction endonuclease